MGSVAEKSEKKRLEEKEIIGRLSSISIPPSIFRNTSLSVLESIVDYLKTYKGLSLREIGVLLDRDERNVWTVYHRALKKK